MKLLKLILILSTFACAAAHRFVYPQTDYFATKCILSNGSAGKCRNIRNCPSAHTSRVPPQTCYFERFEQFVCCQENAINDRIDERPSAKACTEYYPMYYSIAGGIPTKYNEFPYMVAVGWEALQPNEFDYRCGGVLISRNMVLTAAHCAYLRGQAPAVVLLGGVNLTDTFAVPQNISRTYIHPFYKPKLSYNDIALLELAEPIYDQRPACIWSDFALTNTNVTAVGYGHTQFAGAGSSQLLKAHLLAISNGACRRFYIAEESMPNGIAVTQICAKDPQLIRDTCQGDSGGPIIMYSSVGGFTRPYVVGITSFGQGCAGGPPGVYTRVSEYAEWIEEIAWSTTA